MLYPSDIQTLFLTNLDFNCTTFLRPDHKDLVNYIMDMCYHGAKTTPNQVILYPSKKMEICFSFSSLRLSVCFQLLVEHTNAFSQKQNLTLAHHHNVNHSVTPLWPSEAPSGTLDFYWPFICCWISQQWILRMQILFNFILIWNWMVESLAI